MEKGAALNSTRPVKVLHLLGRLVRAGAEMRTLDAMRCLDPHEYRSDICCLSGMAGPLDAEAVRLGAKVHLLRLDARFPVRFLALLRREGYMVVHSHVHRASGFFLALASMAGVPVRIAQLHNTSDSREDSWLRSVRRGLYLCLLMRYATHITAVSHGIMQAIMGDEWHSDSRASIIYEGVDRRLFQASADRAGVRAEFAWPPHSRVCLHVGRFDVPKNHRRLLEIFEHVAALEGDARLLLVGDHATEIGSYCMQRSKSPDLEGLVCLTGPRSDVPRLMLASDLLLLPSLWEGLPGVVIEAAAAGLPVLASDLPGVLEIGEHVQGVTTLSLQKSDELWAKTAARIMRGKETHERAGLVAGHVFDAATYAAKLGCLYGEAGNRRCAEQSRATGT